MNISKNAVAVLCAGLLLFTPYNYPVFPKVLTAYAENYYLDTINESITISETGEHSISGTTTDQQMSINADCTVTLDNVSIELADGVAITICSGKNVTLIIKGENKLSGYTGIKVEEGAVLTIEEEATTNGMLETSGLSGIGVYGSLIINSGTITATGGAGAGIGSTNENHTSGSVTINGGNITATSVTGAGIGCGGVFSFGNVIINGGTVNASSTYGAGIGRGAENNICSSVKISEEATVTAKGGLNVTYDIETSAGSNSNVFIDNGATVNGFTYPPKYTITIPQDFTITEGETYKEVKFSDVNIEPDKQIELSLSAENAEDNHFYLKGTDNSENKIQYYIRYSSDDNNYVDCSPNSALLTLKSEDTEGAVKLCFEPKIKYAGSYTDTLTFTVSMKDIGS